MSTMLSIDSTVFDIIKGTKEESSLNNFNQKDLDDHFRLFMNHKLNEHGLCWTCLSLGYKNRGRCGNIITVDNLKKYLSIMPRPTVNSGIIFIHGVHVRLVRLESGINDRGGFISYMKDSIADVTTVANSVWPEMTTSEAWDIANRLTLTNIKTIDPSYGFRITSIMFMAEWFDTLPLGKQAYGYSHLGWSYEAFVKRYEQGLDVPTFKPDSIEGMIWLSENNMNLDSK